MNSQIDLNSRLPPTQRFKNALEDYTTYSQHAGDVDTSMSRQADAGGIGIKSKAKLTWKDFKAERYESKRDYKKDVEVIALENFSKHVNLANYIIEEPQICHTTDKLRKVCDLFRHMQLRILPVINP